MVVTIYTISFNTNKFCMCPIQCSYIPGVILTKNSTALPSEVLTFRLLMSYIYIYIYMEHLFLMFRDQTHKRSTVGRTPLDE